MLILSSDVFDEVVAGTTTTWYSYAQFNPALGSADSLSVMVYLTNRGTTTPTINLFGDDSIDGRNWVLGNTPLVSSTQLFNTDSLLMYGFKAAALGFNPSPGSFARFRFTLGGAAGVQCRVKLTATGRSL